MKDSQLNTRTRSDTSPYNSLCALVTCFSVRRDTFLTVFNSPITSYSLHAKWRVFAFYRQTFVFDSFYRQPYKRVHWWKACAAWALKWGQGNTPLIYSKSINSSLWFRVLLSYCVRRHTDPFRGARLGFWLRCILLWNARTPTHEWIR